MDLTSLEGSLIQFQQSLDGLYLEMLTLTTDFINLARAVGAIGALLYISSKVWGHFARAEPIDVFPLLRPFAIGLAILIFPLLCTTLRGVTMAVSHGTDGLRVEQVKTVLQLSKDKEAAVQQAKRAGTGDFKQDSGMDAAVKAFTPGGAEDMVVDYVADTAGKFIREGLKDFLQLASMVARLALHLISTLLLTLLSVAGPFVFAIAIFPGFGGGIAKWFGNFITLSLWVPVANIFAMALGKVQIIMLNNDIVNIKAGTSTDAADTGLLLFLALSTIAYIAVPKATDALISAVGGGGATGGMNTVIAGATPIAAQAGAAAGAASRFLLGRK
jgi:conjugative transposon TraJ protein